MKIEYDIDKVNRLNSLRIFNIYRCYLSFLKRVLTSKKIQIVNPRITAPKMKSKRLASASPIPDHWKITCSVIAQRVMNRTKSIDSRKKPHSDPYLGAIYCRGETPSSDDCIFRPTNHQRSRIRFTQPKYPRAEAFLSADSTVEGNHHLLLRSSGIGYIFMQKLFG